MVAPIPGHNTKNVQAYHSAPSESPAHFPPLKELSIGRGKFPGLDSRSAHDAFGPRCLHRLASIKNATSAEVSVGRLTPDAWKPSPFRQRIFTARSRGATRFWEPRTRSLPPGRPDSRPEHSDAEQAAKIRVEFDRRGSAAPGRCAIYGHSSCCVRGSGLHFTAQAGDCHRQLSWPPADSTGTNGCSSVAL
jgi:hypothetical protein